jgi:hypothetical protein
MDTHTDKHMDTHTHTQTNTWAHTQTHACMVTSVQYVQNLYMGPQYGVEVAYIQIYTCDQTRNIFGNQQLVISIQSSASKGTIG